MKKKPSFFERLTGTSWTEEEAPEKNEKKTKKMKKETKIKPSKTTKEKTYQKEVSQNKSPAKPSKENEEWLVEPEGQLTVDVYQTPNEVIIKSTIAGVKPDDIDITMSNDMITIKGSRDKGEEIKEEDYYYQECYWGPFSRSIILPVDVEVDKAKASMKNGILTIKLPKIEKVKTKKITISAE
jgi:HSP20 family protein